MNFEDRFDIKVEAQRARELYPIYMFDIGQIRVVEKQRKEAIARTELTSKCEWEDYK